MATAIPTPGPSVTRQALQDATQEFQSVLDDDQRQELLKIKQDPVPDAEAILVFTARLDSINQHRKGQSFGSRLHKFLSSIRDFCGVIDTYVSAHPEIAALVWASVKLTMSIIANFTSYYDAMSTLFTKMGDLCPLYAEYRILFNESAGLRKSLGDFYASMIRCCTHVVVAIRRPWATHLMKALHSSFDQEFKPDLDEIQRYGNNVEKQIFLAKAQADKQHQKLQETERMEASKGRAAAREHITRTDLSLSTLENSQIQSDREKSHKRARRLLSSLSNHNYARPFYQSTRKRHGNTTNWIHKTSQFQQWINGVSPVVWCSGKIGCGKTIAAAAAIKYIQQPIPAYNTPSVAYMFMQADDNDSLDVNIVMRTLLRQLLDETMVFGELANMLHTIVSSSDQSEIINLLLRLMAAPKKIYIFIDGLDECSKEDRGELFKSLSMLVNAGDNIRLYLSSRESIGREVKAYFQGFEHISLDCQATRNDIANYITDTIDEKLQQGELKIGDGELVDEIKNALVDGAQGMYLWAYFQIEEICFQHCDQDIRQALNDLPRDLAEVFRRVLHRINIRRHGPAVRKVAPLVASAKRPLSIGELREATAVELGRHHLKASRLFNDMGNISSWSENLIQVDEDNNTVQFAHSAVKDFLVDISSDSDSTLTDFHIDLEISDHQLGEICVTYLNFDKFKASVALRPQSMTISPMQIIPTVIKPALGVGTILSDLNIIPGEETVDLRRQLSNFLSTQSPFAKGNWKASHPFLDYASTFWITHTKRFQQEKSKTWTIWESLLTHGHTFAKVPWEEEGRPFRGAMVTYDDPVVNWASRNCHRAIIRHLISRNSSALKYAILCANIELFDAILDEHYKCKLLTRHDGSQALRCAVDLRIGYCVNRLLATGVDVNSTTIEDNERGPWSQLPDRVCALHISAGRGYIDMVNSLLASGADVNLASRYGRTALQMAAAHGKLAVVKALLASGAEVDLRLPHKQTALQSAAEHGHVEVVNALLAVGANPNARPPQYSHISALHGDEERRKPLFLAVDPNWLASAKYHPLGPEANANGVACEYYMTAVQAAKSESSFQVSQRLFLAGSDPSAPPTNIMGTALEGAAERGHLEVVDVLLAAGVDPNTPPSTIEGNALTLAAGKNQVCVVNTLLAAGANPNFPVRVGFNSPLVLAVERRYPGVVCQLLAAGARLEESALQIAVDWGFWEILNVLLKAGNDSNAANFLQMANLWTGNKSIIVRATRSRQFEVVNTLLSYGGREPPYQWLRDADGSWKQVWASSAAMSSPRRPPTVPGSKPILVAVRREYQEDLSSHSRPR